LEPALAAGAQGFSDYVLTLRVHVASRGLLRGCCGSFGVDCIHDLLRDCFSFLFRFAESLSDVNSAMVAEVYFPIVASERCK
jgi:hypothetical protein